eukprot:TRINITY_DN2800_c0_g1_i1.p1 TRINITY_DN2800_c0_g1~~TRINITY_DN2800_c0_g1_i1.p1  ORF type:complete len:108 (-),score=26.62 TRINITY_DN2800_c0_g1_i1:159-449(-)
MEGGNADMRSRIQAMLTQPLADKSLPLFKEMMWKWRRPKLMEVFKSEMEVVSRRGSNGETDMAIAILLSQKKPQAKQHNESTSHTTSEGQMIASKL